MKPQLHKSQRKRLFALARLLDRVPKKHFDIGVWIDGYSIEALKQKKCGTAACACGWGMTSPFIRGSAYSASQLRSQLLPEEAQLPLFGGHRDEEKPAPTPKSVAKEIRRYLEDGMLPCDG